MIREVRVRWSSFVARQHRCPSGIAGVFIGERMRHQHAPETRWSIDLLALERRDRVLDIGAGAGHALALALPQVQQGYVVAFDLSRAMLTVSTLRHRAMRRAGRLALVRGDFSDLPFAGGSFDKIVTIHTFYFWSEPIHTARHLLRALASGGRLVITLATAETQPDGTRRYWPLHEEARVLTAELNRYPGLTARVIQGPDSRQYNNIAIVVDKA